MKVSSYFDIIKKIIDLFQLELEKS